MSNTVDKVLYVNKNKTVIYLVGRQFSIETTNGNALKLVLELLAPYFRQQKLKTEESTIVLKRAA